MVYCTPNKKECCGCSACSQACPKHCIKMVEDYEGFLYPDINKDLCVDCGICDKVCPFLNPYNSSIPILSLGAYNRDDTIRKNSSSGGVFYSMAMKVIENGGVVFGACFDENWEVVINYTEKLSEIHRFQGSKYLQAKVGNSFSICKDFLEQGREVLFTGTPCQISGLKHYLRRDYDNIYLLDFICHGVPSPKVWRLYLSELQYSINNRPDDKTNSISFRAKPKGWKNFHFSITRTEGGNTIQFTMPYDENEYMKMFLNNTTLRPSCFACKVKGCSSQSDITIGDFWGIQNVNPEFDDDNGASVILVNSQRGKRLLSSQDLKTIEISFEDTYAHNSSLLKSSIPNKKREYFFEFLEQGSILELMKDFLKPTFKEQIKQLLKRTIRKLGGGIFFNFK